jgi:hypothetical protein
MAVTTSYLNSTKNLESILNSIIGARAPDRFTSRFLEDLGYKSSSDRLIIGILKSLGLIDENGVPKQRYYDFLDQSQSKSIIATGIQEAYKDLFNIKKDAQNMSNDDVKNKLKTLTQGQKGDRAIELMSMTFRALCNYADWSKPSKSHKKVDTNSVESINIIEQGNELHVSDNETYTKRNDQINLHYNIQIHLPETVNMAVYDAIFQSLRKHLA